MQPSSKIQRRGSSFFLPMLLLSRRKRQAMQALYYFCRVVDDAVDEAATPEEAEKNLAFWRREIAFIYDRSIPEHPISQQLAEAVQDFAMPRRYFDDLLAGLEKDCARPVTVPDWPTLQDYCYRVAGCVGLQAMRIFGHTDAAAENFARALGQALQLTNILRDIAEDGREGRCYLPQDWLAEAGLEGAPPGQIAVAGDRLDPLRQRLMQEAEAAFAEADRLAEGLPTADILPALLMRDTYRRKLQRMREGKPAADAKVLELARLGRDALHYHRQAS